MSAFPGLLRGKPGKLPPKGDTYMNKLSSLKKYVINMKIRRKVLLIFLLVGVLPFLCYIIFPIAIRTKSCWKGKPA